MTNKLKIRSDNNVCLDTVNANPTCMDEMDEFYIKNRLFDPKLTTLSFYLEN